MFLSKRNVFFMNLITILSYKAIILVAKLKTMNLIRYTVHREMWLAREPKERGIRFMDRPRLVIISQTGMSSCHTPLSCSNIIINIQNHDMDVRGLNDIGFNFLIGGDGHIYEGLGWDYIGAHSVGYNNNSIGIGIIGNFDDQAPSISVIAAINLLLRNGVNMKKLNEAYIIYGHNETSNTNEGQELFNLIIQWPQWREHPKFIRTWMWGSSKLSNANNVSLFHEIPKYVIISHSATALCHTRDKCTRIVQNIENQHVNITRWGAIGYNFLIGGDCNVYVGRGWNVIGLHSSAKYDSKSIGICVIGNFQHNHPSLDLTKTIQNVLDYAVAMKKISPDYILFGAREVSFTSSPGDYLYNILKKHPHWIFN